MVKLGTITPAGGRQKNEETNVFNALFFCFEMFYTPTLIIFYQDFDEQNYVQLGLRNPPPFFYKTGVFFL